MKYYKKVLASFLVILMLSSVFSTGATATDMLGVVSAVDNIETHEDHSAITGQALDAAITAAEEEMSKDEFFEYFSSLPGTTTENEYDAFLAEQSQAITRIRNGEAQAGDEELAAFDYREYYYDLKELSESELAYLGYDQNRINIIKNFQGSDAEIRRASADVSGTVLIILSQINDNVVTTRVRYRFYVDGVFARKKTDNWIYALSFGKETVQVIDTSEWMGRSYELIAVLYTHKPTGFQFTNYCIRPAGIISSSSRHDLLLYDWAEHQAGADSY